MKKVYVYKDGQMVEKPRREREHSTIIMGDIPDFVSTVDGRIIRGRRGLREHNREHNVTNPADYKETWANFQKKREALFTARDNDPKRKEAIIRAFNDLQYRR